MYRKFLLFCLIAATFQSCSNSYKVTQTPDDVYFSPITGNDNVRREDTRNRYSYTEDRQYTMSRHDRRWRDLDGEYNYGYDPYHYGFNYGYYYNPYYYPYPVYNYGGYSLYNPKNATPRTTNLSSYQFQNMNVYPKSTGPVRFTQPVRSYNNSNYDYNNTRETITPRHNSSGSDNNTRSYSPTSSGSSSGSSSGTSIVRPNRN